MIRFQPTLPLRGATDACWRCRGINPVSTHAPLAGSDTPRAARFTRTACFNPRSPCGERREPPLGLGCPSGFNPRSPCGERRLLARLERQHRYVSTHAPLAGSDPKAGKGTRRHACFNPRSPCGERHYGVMPYHPAKLFQPTLPLRGATSSTRRIGRPPRSFNPRSPCGERPPGAAQGAGPGKGFNPRSPCGERPTLPWAVPVMFMFQPTLPLRGATLVAVAVRHVHGVSTHAPLAGSDMSPSISAPRRAVSTHAPLAGSDVINTQFANR